MGWKRRLAGLWEKLKGDKGVFVTAPSVWSPYGEPPEWDYETYEYYYRNDASVRAGINILAEMVVGGGYYIVCEDEELHRKVTDFLDRNHFETLMLETVKNMFIYGNAFLEKVFENGELVKLKLLPTKYMRVKRDKYGRVEKYVEHIGTEKVEFEPNEVIHLKYDAFGTSAYGLSVIHPLVELLKIKHEVLKDMSLILKRYASPLIVWKVPNEASARKLREFLATRSPEEDIMVKDTVGFEVVSIDPRTKFEYYIEYVDKEIFEGIGAPLLYYVRNSTEASASIMNDIVSNRVNAVQKYLKREIEEQILKEFGEGIQFEWGIPKSEVEGLEFGDIARLVDAGAISSFDSRNILRKMGLPLEDGEKVKEVLENLLEYVSPKPRIIDAGTEIWYVIYPYEMFLPQSLRTVTLDKNKGVSMVVGTMPKLGMRFIHKFVFRKAKGWDEGKVKDYVKSHFSWW